MVFPDELVYMAFLWVGLLSQSCNFRYFWDFLIWNDDGFWGLKWKDDGVKASYGVLKWNDDRVKASYGVLKWNDDGVKASYGVLKWNDGGVKAFYGVLKCFNPIIISFYGVFNWNDDRVKASWAVWITVSYHYQLVTIIFTNW